MALRNLLFKKQIWLKQKKFFLSHQPSIFQEHAAQRCQSRKPKACGNGADLTASEAAC